MNKKALELSVNFMVIIIISIVIFSLGISLINMFSERTEQIRTNVEDITERDVQDILTQGEIVSIPKYRQPIKKGDKGAFHLSIVNVYEQQTTFTVSIPF